jgi:hypothetical protein
MKRCRNCNIDKSLNNFSKDKSQKDGLQFYCKSCRSNINQNSYRKLIPSLKYKYKRMRQNSVNRKHNPPEFTYDELYEYAISNGYIELHQNWIDNEYDKKLNPSFDRLDNTKGYSFDNIELVTWEENYLREVKRKKLKHENKKR